MAKKLDIQPRLGDTQGMTPRSQAPSSGAASAVRHRVEHGGERVWRFEDFQDLPSTAVAQALSRLTRAYVLRRLSKGIYYRERTTMLGASRPNAAALQQLASRTAPIFPSGVAAANALGFTTQAPARSEVSTSKASLPRKLLGEGTRVHTRRPAAWEQLSVEEGALLELLRNGARDSELSPQDTVTRALKLLSDEDRFAHLLRVADSEPPRVRALLGALGTELGAEPTKLAKLRASLNPLSRFDFGAFAGMTSATAWQAKGQGRRAAV